jgi:RNA polymerase sigma-70 factor (ECF subfamily)
LPNVFHIRAGAETADLTVPVNDIDNKLLQQCARGERKAQYRLYGLCFSFLMGICVRYSSSREDAEEVLNQSFLKILNSITAYKKEIPFAMWIRRIAINTAIDAYRRQAKEKKLMVLTDYQEEHIEASCCNEYLRKIDAEQLDLLIGQLPEASRRVFNLFVVDGYSHKEIAALLEISEGTSKWHVNFARTQLKQLIVKYSCIKTVAS